MSGKFTQIWILLDAAVFCFWVPRLTIQAFTPNDFQLIVPKLSSEKLESGLDVSLVPVSA